MTTQLESRRITAWLSLTVFGVTLLATAIVEMGRDASAGEKHSERPRDQIGEVLGKPVYRHQIHADSESSDEDELHRLFAAPVLERYCDAHKSEVTPTRAELAEAEAFIEKKTGNPDRSQELSLRKQLNEVDKQLRTAKLTEHSRERLEIKKDLIEYKIAEVESNAEAKQKAKKEHDSWAKELEETPTAPGLTPEERKELDALKRLVKSRIARPYQMFAVFLLGNWKLQRHFYDRYGGGRVLWQQAGLEAFDAYRKWLESEERKGSFKISDPKVRAAFYHYWRRSHTPYMIDDENRIRDEFLQPEWAPGRKRAPSYGK